MPPTPPVSGRSRGGADVETARGTPPASPASPAIPRPRADERPVCRACVAAAPRAVCRACGWLTSGAPSEADEAGGSARPSQLLGLSSLVRRLGVERREIGDFCRAPRPHRSLRSGPGRCSVASQVRSAARSRESPPQQARLTSCGDAKTGLWTCRVTSQHGRSPLPVPCRAPR